MGIYRIMYIIIAVALLWASITLEPPLEEVTSLLLCAIFLRLSEIVELLNGGGR